MKKFSYDPFKRPVTHKTVDFVVKHVADDFIVEEVAGYDLLKTGSQTIFLLKKKDITTFAAVEQIAQVFKINSRLIRFAGLKDAKASTSQYISIPASANIPKTYTQQKWSITHVGFLNEQLYIGKLKGNKFTLIVRGISNAPKQISMMINYFGVQRFSEHNAQIGKSIIKKDYLSALTLLKNQSNFVEVVATQTRPDAKILLDSDEQKITSHQELSQFSQHQLFTLLLKQDHKLLKLCLAAYQSLLWNKSVLEYSKPHKPELGQTMPLFGFGLDHAESNFAIVQKIAAEEGVQERDFILPQMPNFGLEGSSRQVYIPIDSLIIGKLSDDDFHPGKKKCTISFMLQKGAYATECIKQLFDDKRIAGIDDFSNVKFSDVE